MISEYDVSGKDVFRMWFVDYTWQSGLQVAIFRMRVSNLQQSHHSHDWSKCIWDLRCCYEEILFGHEVVSSKPSEVNSVCDDYHRFVFNPFVKEISNPRCVVVFTLTETLIEFLLEVLTGRVKLYRLPTVRIHTGKSGLAYATRYAPNRSPPSMTSLYMAAMTRAIDGASGYGQLPQYTALGQSPPRES